MQLRFFMAAALALSTTACLNAKGPGLDTGADDEADGGSGGRTSGSHTGTAGRTSGASATVSNTGGVARPPTTGGVVGGNVGSGTGTGTVGWVVDAGPPGMGPAVQCDDWLCCDAAGVCCHETEGWCVGGVRDSGATGTTVGGHTGTIPATTGGPVGGTGTGPRTTGVANTGFVTGGVTGSGGPITGTGGAMTGGIVTGGVFDGGVIFGDGGAPEVEITDEPWEPPIELEPAGTEPAWRESTEPLCTEQQGYLTSHAVWSDNRGVFTLVSGHGFPFGFGGPILLDGPFPVPCDGERCTPMALWFNDGTGWEPYFEVEGSSSREFWSDQKLAGVPGGPLFAYGFADSFDGRGCGLATITPEGRECEPVWGVEDLVVVNENLAYALSEGALLEYRDGGWGPSPGVLNPNSSLTRVWADETSVFATTYSGGQLLQRVDGEWTVLDTRTLQTFSSLWGYSATDLYAGTEQGGLFHYDGATLSEIPWDRQSCDTYSPAVTGIWGMDGVTYFHTNNQLARVVDGTAEVIAEWPCSDTGDMPRIMSIWGNGPDELFVALADMRTPRQECGVTFLLYYDGESFHRL